MANYRLAKNIQKQLNQLYNDLDTDFDDEHLKEIRILKEAQKRRMKLVQVSVADGHAIYWQTHRTKRYTTFEWLWGGADGYIPEWGNQVLVPNKKATQLLREFRKHLKEKEEYLRLKYG